MRYPATQGKRDANEPEIITACESVGATVQVDPMGQGRPDLLIGADMPCPACGHMFPQNKLVEVKVPGGKMNETQITWHDNWKGQCAVAHNEDEALKVIGFGYDMELDERFRRCQES